jgi:hypothetical protein
MREEWLQQRQWKAIQEGLRRFGDRRDPLLREEGEVAAPLVEALVLEALSFGAEPYLEPALIEARALALEARALRVQEEAYLLSLRGARREAQFLMELSLELRAGARTLRTGAEATARLTEVGQTAARGARTEATETVTAGRNAARTQVPGMAAPGIPNPELLARVNANRAAIEREVAQRMLDLGVEPEFIGIKGYPGVDEHAFVRNYGPQAGGNIRTDHPNVVAGLWKAGINIDEAVFDPTFQALAREPRLVSKEAANAYHTAWASASDQTRMEAVIAHEYAELKATATPEFQQQYGSEWAHYAAVKNAPDTSLKISPEAKELLRLHRRAVGLE